MKVAVIGKGTSAIITALTLIRDGHEVEIFYDPESPHLSVGESTTPSFAELIEKTLDISIGRLSAMGIVSFKNGIKFIGWGQTESFKHHFNDNSCAFQFETGVFNPFIHERIKSELNVVYHAERVNDYNIDGEYIHINEKQYDFMVNCSGWNDDGEYYEPYFETVNSAILYSENKVEDSTYTLHRATPHGWQFGLPFPDKGITKCGYLYNKNYNTEEEVEKLFEGVQYRKISWKQKYSKKILKNRFIAYNGNRLFFYEPLQALSLLYYNSTSNLISRFLTNAQRSTYAYYKINAEYLQLMHEYQLALSLHYKYGSKYNTEFWNKTTESAKNYLEINPMYREQSLYDSYYGDMLSSKLDGKESDILRLACFASIDYRDIHSGMTGIDIDTLKNDPNIFHYPPVKKPFCNDKPPNQNY